MKTRSKLDPREAQRAVLQRRNAVFAMRVLCLVLLAAAVSAAVLSKAEEEMLENPIRRIVNLLQKMQKEVPPPRRFYIGSVVALLFTI